MAEMGVSSDSNLESPWRGELCGVMKGKIWLIVWKTIRVVKRLGVVEQ